MMTEHCRHVAEALFKYLMENQIMTPEEMQEMQEDMMTSKKDPSQLLVQKGFFKLEELGRLIAELNNWRYVFLQNEHVDKEVMRLIPEEVARKQIMMPFKRDEDGICVAMCNPTDITLIHFLQKHLGENIIPYFALPCDLNNYYGLYKDDIKAEFQKIFDEEIGGAAQAKLTENSTVKVVDLILHHAYDLDASDVHFEPHEDKTLIRFRVDGLLRDVLSVPKNIHNQIISRIKVMAHLHTDEHYIPQDGKIIYRFVNQAEDIRVSIVPTVTGENAVLRLLSDKCKVFDLEDLGLSKKDYEKLDKIIRKSWGMILVTGPTGSGKTTTLYAILRKLHQKTVHIATIEDPVEFSIDGITQIQVNPRTELTFAAGLKSIVRQDPDIIMVGEIRDTETADIAVNSAMTGHLVLSTLHTNDAATTLPRLLDMDVEPFLISSTVNIVIAQRLVRQICPKCSQTEVIELEQLKKMLPKTYHEKLKGLQPKLNVYKGKGCEYCSQDGYRGRIGIFEILEINDEIKDLIMKNADAVTIRRKAVESGLSTMFENSLDKLFKGITTVDEIVRVLNS